MTILLIELEYTTLEDLSINEENYISENDWYFYLIEKKQFRALGDLSKLSFLLSVFRSIAENGEHSLQA